MISNIKQFYFRFESTFIWQMFSKSNIFVSERLSLLFAYKKTFRCKNKKKFHFCFENNFNSKVFSKSKTLFAFENTFRDNEI